MRIMNKDEYGEIWGEKERQAGKSERTNETNKKMTKRKAGRNYRKTNK